jgi:hypothetical protein
VRSWVTFGPETWVGPKPPPELLLRHAAGTRHALGHRAQIRLASAAGRVSVSGLDSWLALAEQPPRTDEDSEMQDIARTFPLRSARALEKTRNRIGRHPCCPV